MSSTSCKNDIEQIVEEDPVFYLLSQPNIIIDTVTSTAKKWDYGFAFNTTKKGNVQKLGLVLPVVGKFKVKLFALSNDSILIEKEIESKKSGSKNFLDIKSIPLSTNSEYGISVNANSFYKMRKPDSTNFAFPMAARQQEPQQRRAESHPGQHPPVNHQPQRGAHLALPKASIVGARAHPLTILHKTKAHAVTSRQPQRQEQQKQQREYLHHKRCGVMRNGVDVLQKRACLIIPANKMKIKQNLYFLYLYLFKLENY